MTLGFAGVNGEELCKCNRTVCYCSKWKKQNANTQLEFCLLYSNCSLLKLVWLMFGGVIFMLFPSVRLSIFPTPD